MKHLIWMVVASIFVVSCTNSGPGRKVGKGFTKAKNGIYYKIYADKNSKDSLLKANDQIAYSMVRIFGDSTEFNSYERGHLIGYVDTLVRNSLDYMFVTSKMRVSDSVAIQVSTDTIYNYFLKQAKQDPSFKEAVFKKTIPEYFQKKKHYVTLGIKILDRFETDRTKPNFVGDSARFMSFKAAQDQVIQTYNQKRMEEEEKKAKVLNDKNMEIGRKFLEGNKSKAGVIVTDSGSQYTVIKLGTGKKPIATDRVKCDYTLTNLEGKKIQSSKDMNQPAIFQINGVIPGWKEILQLMPAGSTYKVWIPANLAYGIYGQPSQGDAPGIDPGQLLVFEIDLLEVNPEMPKAPETQKQSGQHSKGDGHNH